MIAQIIKIGSKSLGIIIPPTQLKFYNLKEGDFIDYGDIVKLKKKDNSNDIGEKEDK